MKIERISPVYLAAGAAVLVAFLWAKSKGAAGTGQAIGAAAVDLADGILTGAVVGTGQLVGIPPTNQTECDKAKAEGRTWDASFACPAGNFIKYLFS